VALTLTIDDVSVDRVALEVASTLDDTGTGPRVEMMFSVIEHKYGLKFKVTACYNGEVYTLCDGEAPLEVYG
jgi:hypothetical protein